MAVNFPNPTSRTVVSGSTGSGKTFFGVWLLSTRNWQVRPFFVIDFKHDELIAAIMEAAGGREIDVRAKPPTKPGLYVVRPRPMMDDDALNEFFMKIWAVGNAGIFVDEGYMIPNPSIAFTALLTQGRSKKIEMITLSQRPVRMNRFVFSEAEYFAVFRLNDLRDRKTVAEMTGMNINYNLPKYHCIWYDGGANEQCILGPVPKRTELIALFRKSPQRKARAV